MISPPTKMTTGHTGQEYQQPMMVCIIVCGSRVEEEGV